jgi:hypothetical protein
VFLTNFPAEIAACATSLAWFSSDWMFAFLSVSTASTTGSSAW